MRARGDDLQEPLAAVDPRGPGPRTRDRGRQVVAAGRQMVREPEPDVDLLAGTEYSGWGLVDVVRREYVIVFVVEQVEPEKRVLHLFVETDTQDERHRLARRQHLQRPPGVVLELGMRDLRLSVALTELVRFRGRRLCR